MKKQILSNKAALAEGDEEETARIAKELNAIRNEERNYLGKMAHGGRPVKGIARDAYAAFGIGSEALPLEKIVMTISRPEGRPGNEEQYRKWRTFSAEMSRASELPFPAPRGHFLGEFGQSDREGIQNSVDSASVPQALSLLNGPIAEGLANPNSLLQLELAKIETSQEKIDTLFLSVLSRLPTSAEREFFEFEIEAETTVSGTVLWVLLNSQQFRFLE